MSIDWNDPNNAGLRDTVTKQALEIDRIPESSWSALTPNEQTLVVATGVVVSGFIVYKINDVLFKVPAVGAGGTAVLGQSFDKMGIYVKNPNINVNWSLYSEHGLRLAERGMSKELVNSIVQNGKVLSQNGGEKFAYITKEGVVIVAKDGKLVTAWSKNFYDNNMIQIVNSLFGK